MGRATVGTSEVAASVSVVIPVFRNKETVRPTLEQILKVRGAHFPELGLEVVFVDDGSGDGSWEELEAIHHEWPEYVTLVKLSRNFGQLCAILAGYDAAKGDAIITISADLQDPVELMGEMITQWKAGSEVVIAHREDRHDDLASTIFSGIAYWTARRANPRMPVGGFDYLLLSRRAMELLCSFKGRHRFFQGDVLWLGLPTAFLPYVRQARVAGRSGWTFRKKFKYFTDLVLDSSYLPIRLMSGLGFLTAVGGLLYAIVVVWAWFANLTPFSGYAPIMITLLVIGGLIMMMLGIIGEYIWRIYDDVKLRPLFIVDRKLSSFVSAIGTKANATPHD